MYLPSMFEMNLWVVDKLMGLGYSTFYLPLSVSFVPVEWATITSAHTIVREERQRHITTLAMHYRVENWVVDKEGPIRYLFPITAI